MIVELKILNCFCEVTVKAVTLESDAALQPLIVEYWDFLFKAAPDESYRRGYSRFLITEKTRQEALNKLKVLNAVA
jgi:hypothetical protein